MHEVIIPKSLFSWATVVMKGHWQQNKNKKFASKIRQIINKISEMKDTVAYTCIINEANVYMAWVYNCTCFNRNTEICLEYLNVMMC